jgi:hypothetical protein
MAAAVRLSAALTAQRELAASLVDKEATDVSRLR